MKPVKSVGASLLVTAACLGIVVLAISHLPAGHQEGAKTEAGHDHGVAGKSGEAAGETVYTCSMHPSVRRSEPGKCPICHMDLIPVVTTGGGNLSGGSGPTGVGGAGNAMGGPTGVGGAGIETIAVQKRKFRRTRQLTGRVVPDVSSKTVVTSWVDGRVEKAYVHFEGERIAAWQPVALLFSPMLTGAQAEFLALNQTIDGAPSPLRTAGEMRLANLGMTPGDIRGLVRSGKPSRYNPVYASSGGIVIRRNVFEGSQIMRGEVLYEVVDNRKVWLEFDVSQRDNWIRPGQELIVRAEGLEPIPFLAVVDYADYQVNEKTRTFMVRATQDNATGLFRFGAWVRAEAKESVDAAHPDGLDTLMVPASSVLYTGKRSVVYVADEKGGFSPREVGIAEDEMILDGQRWIAVLTGLSEHEIVALRGAFVIDSNRRIEGSPSMMTLPKMEPDARDPGKSGFVGAPLSVVLRMDSLALKYFAVWKSLAGDDAAGVAAAALALRGELGTSNKKESAQWAEIRKALTGPLEKMTEKAGLAAIRKEFSQLSDALWGIFRKFGFPPHVNVLRMHCPMAFENHGAFWMQPAQAVENPYFGKEMFRCGSVVSPGAGGTP